MPNGIGDLLEKCNLLNLGLIVRLYTFNCIDWVDSLEILGCALWEVT